MKEQGNLDLVPSFFSEAEISNYIFAVHRAMDDDLTRKLDLVKKNNL